MSTTPLTDNAPDTSKTSVRGLSSEEARQRLGEYGFNELARAGVRWEAILLRQFASPFLYLLVAAALIAWALGETVDAAMIVGFVVLNAGLGFGQEYRSERAVELLRTFVRARARVRRDGTERLVDGRELVPGDVIVIETGDVIQADVRILEEIDLTVDESVLTGESVPVRKTSAVRDSSAAEAREMSDMAFAATTVVSGRGVGIVTATGAGTQIGDVAALTGRAEGQSAFEKNIRSFSSVILRVILVTLVLAFVANVALKGSDANIPQLLVFSIALAVSVIPEALPLVTTMTLSRGALRLAKRNVVVKRLSSVEDLGSIEVLCSDKTGTITENKMRVAETWGDDRERCLYLAALGSSFLTERRATPNNAFDLAVWNCLDEARRARAVAEERTDEVPFDPAKRWNSVVVGDGLVVRGAPEEVAALCADDRTAGRGREALLSWAAGEGRNGRRVLAVALGASGARADDGGLALVGAISFEDPVKDSAAEAVADARRLGVSVKILTGDAPEVAASVARKIRLISSDDEVLTGAQWEALPESERLPSAQAHAVFARVSPRQKFLIIQSLRGCCEVGFLGEGINDAPALNASSVGIVVDGASDIAREAADIILLEHSLKAIVGGIREGREVFANTIKYVKATLASNFGNFLAVATAAILVDYLPMLPVQILLVNLFSDFPMIAIATDAVDGEELRRPRSYDLRDIVLVSAVLGAVSTAFDFLFFLIFSRSSPEFLQTYWFIGSILTELLLIFSIRTRGPFWRAVWPSGALLGLSVTAAVATVAIPFAAAGRSVFHFVRPDGRSLATVFALVAAYFVVTEAAKRGYYRQKGKVVKTRQSV